jgi:DNA-binding MarR family transcriptional regulator
MSSNNNAFEMASRFLRAWQELNKKIDIGSVGSILESLNVSQLRILQLVRDQPGISAQEIINHLELAPDTAKNLILAMQKLGLVTLERTADEKLPHVRLGAQGQRLSYQVQATQLVMVAELLGGLPLDEQLCAVEALERVVMLDLD